MKWENGFKFLLSHEGDMIMEGWTEEEIRNKNLMAPCGLYCGACGVYLATRDENEKFRAVMGNPYGTNQKKRNVLAVCSLIHPRSSMVIAKDARSGIA